MGVAMRLIARLVERVPWLIIAVFVVLTAAFGSRLPNIEIDAEVKNQLPEEMPARLNIRQIESRFGGSEMVMVVLEADDVLQVDVLQRLIALGEGLAALDGVDHVMSPFTLNRIEGSADGLMNVGVAIDEHALPNTAEARASLAEQLQNNDLVYGNVIGRDFRAAAAIAMLGTGATDSETVAAVQALVEATPGPGTVSIGGMPDVRTRVSEDIRGDIRRFLPIGLLLVLGFLYGCFRQARGVLLPFSVVVMSVTVAMGLIPILGWKVQMVTVTLPVILLAVANDYGIHLLAKYQEENRPGADASSAQLAATVLKDLGPPVFAAGITTMAGLLCLWTHIVVPAQQLGVLAATGVFFALCASLLFIPAVLTVMPVAPPLKTLASEGAGGGLEGLLRRLADTVARFPGRWLAFVIVFGVAASTGMWRLNVDTNPINYYAADAPVRQVSDTINEHFGGSTEVAVMFEGDMQDPAVLGRIDGLENRLSELPQVGLTSSIAQFVQTMNAAVSGDDAQRTIPQSKQGVAELFLLFEMGGDPESLERLVDFDYEHALLTARVNSLSTEKISEVVELVKSDVGDDANVVVGGFGPVFADLVEAVVQGQVTSLGLSLLLVLIMVALAFRSFWAGVYATLPLLLAMPLLFGLMGYLRIELNVVTAMLSSIMVGVGIDYTLHFLWRYRDERAAGLEPEAAVVRTLTTAGRGIVFNALSVVVGFAVLLISNFMPVQFFGFLVVVSISACLVGALVMLPAIVLLTRPRFLEPLPVITGTSESQH